MKRRLRFPIWAKTLIVLLLSISIVSIVAVVISSRTLRDITRSRYAENATHMADTLGIYVDIEDVKTLKEKVDVIYKSIPLDKRVNNSYWDEPEWEEYLKNFEDIVELPEYKRLFAQIEQFHSKNEAKYTYLAYADFDGKNLVYLVDDSPEDEICLPGSFDLFTEQDMTIFDHMNTGFEPEVTNTPEYGYLVSVGRPIFEGESIVAFALVDLSMDEIIAKENQETQRLAIILFSIGGAAILGAFLLVIYLIVHPIHKLTRAANDYTSGNDESLQKFSKVMIRTRDEIEDLANSMKKMESDINQYIEDLIGEQKRNTELRTLVDKDPLTGTGNKRAYFEKEEELNNLIKDGKAKYAVAMIDLNDLKIINDTLGHEKGDAAIKELANTIKQAFHTSNIFRVGGDEFVVIYEGDEVKHISNEEKDFIELMKKNDKISAAIGTATYISSIDNNLEDTFKRADAKMYENKKSMKDSKEK